MTQAMLDYAPRTESDCEQILRIFRQQPPGTWISALKFASVCLAWRTRISDLRHPPYSLTVENKTEQHGREKHSFYRLVA